MVFQQYFSYIETYGPTIPPMSTYAHLRLAIHS
jgi:hypothetical protein